MFRSLILSIVVAVAMLALVGQSRAQAISLLPANCFYFDASMTTIDCYGVVTAQTPGIPGGYVCFSRANVFSVCSIP